MLEKLGNTVIIQVIRQVPDSLNRSSDATLQDISWLNISEAAIGGSLPIKLTDRGDGIGSGVVLSLGSSFTLILGIKGPLWFAAVILREKHIKIAVYIDHNTALEVESILPLQYEYKSCCVLTSFVNGHTQQSIVPQGLNTLQ